MFGIYENIHLNNLRASMNIAESNKKLEREAALKKFDADAREAVVRETSKSK